VTEPEKMPPDVDLDESPFKGGSFEGLPFKRGSEEDQAIRRILERDEEPESARSP
jgi:hypothetical protein